MCKHIVTFTFEMADLTLYTRLLFFCYYNIKHSFIASDCSVCSLQNYFRHPKIGAAHKHVHLQCEERERVEEECEGVIVYHTALQLL